MSWKPAPDPHAIKGKPGASKGMPLSCCSGVAGTLPFLPQLSPHPASPSSDFCPCRGHFLCPVWAELMPSPLPIPNSSFNVFSRASL